MKTVWQERNVSGEAEIIRDNMSEAFNYNCERFGGWKVAEKGKFNPINPQKYAGDAKNIWYRSSWEKACMHRFDTDPNVIYWASEELIIPYADRGTRDVHGNPKIRRYFPDFVIKIRSTEGTIKTIVIEVKPYCQTVPPVKGKKTEKRFLSEVKTFATNYSKFEHAREYCRRKGWEFVVLTERELGIR